MSRSTSHAVRQRGGIRSLLGVVVALAGLMTSTVVLAPSASAAGWGSCYRQGTAWSFKHLTGSYTSQIDAWPNASCSGSSVLRGKVSYNSRTRHVSIYAYDFKADGHGVTLYTHGPSVSANGNGTSTSGGGNLSSFQRPYNFWIRVGNAQNSVSQPFPSF